MNWESIALHWGEYKLNARRRWNLLTSGDLEAIGGDRERLLARIAELYAIPREEAEAQLADWLAALREVNPFR